MNEHTLTILAAILLYTSRAKSDDMPEQKAKFLAEALEEAQSCIAQIAAKVQG